MIIYSSLMISYLHLVNFLNGHEISSFNMYKATNTLFYARSWTWTSVEQQQQQQQQFWYHQPASTAPTTRDQYPPCPRHGIAPSDEWYVSIDDEKEKKKKHKEESLNRRINEKEQVEQLKHPSSSN